MISTILVIFIKSKLSLSLVHLSLSTAFFIQQFCKLTRLFGSSPMLLFTAFIKVFFVLFLMFLNLARFFFGFILTLFLYTFFCYVISFYRNIFLCLFLPFFFRTTHHTPLERHPWNELKSEVSTLVNSKTSFLIDFIVIKLPSHVMLFFFNVSLVTNRLFFLNKPFSNIKFILP